MFQGRDNAINLLLRNCEASIHPFSLCNWMDGQTKERVSRRQKRLRDRGDRETTETERSRGQQSIASSLWSHGLLGPMVPKKLFYHYDVVRRFPRSLRSLGMNVVVEYHPSLRGGHRPTWQSHTHTLLPCPSPQPKRVSAGCPVGGLFPSNFGCLIGVKRLFIHSIFL